LRVAFVYDYLNNYGGAEKVLEVLHELFPDAPIYTLTFDSTHIPDCFRKRDIKESFIGRFPFIKRQCEKYSFLTPLAIESFDLNNYELVISLSSGWSYNIITLPSTIHINYMLNPKRFAWTSYHPMLEVGGGFNKVLFFLGLHFIRDRSESICRKPDTIVAGSKRVENRVEDLYSIKPETIPPPVDTDFYFPNKKVKKEDYFLIVSKLLPCERIDVAISAFNRTKLPLLIIGEGSEKGNLERSAKRNIQFLGKRVDEEVRSFYRRAKALIVPVCDDFGIFPLEACACGTPVIAFSEGGASEVIEEGRNGIFFYPQSPEALIDTVLNFSQEDFNESNVREVSLRFNKRQFIENFRRKIEEIEEKKKN